MKGDFLCLTYKAFFLLPGEFSCGTIKQEAKPVKHRDAEKENV